MITDAFLQHELLKTAMKATDNYLAVEKRAMDAGAATNSMIHDFSYHMAIAHDALQSLGVLNRHQAYMNDHVQIMLKLHGHKDTTMGDLPYAHVPKADFGEVDESVKPIKIKITTPKPTAQERMYAQQQALRKKRGLPDPEYYKKLAQQKAQEILDLKKESTIISFNTFLNEQDENEDEVISEKEISEMVDDLQWEDIVDLYDDEELVYDPESEEEVAEEEPLDEKLSVQSRLKKRQAFARFKGRRNVARNIKLRRASSMNVLKKRAGLAARRAVYKRFLRGRDKSTLSAAEKDRIEQQVSRMKFIQSAIAVKMLPKMRAIEQKRLSNIRTKSSAPKLKPSKAPRLK
jgi:hypothetical protein